MITNDMMVVRLGEITQSNHHIYIFTDETAIFLAILIYLYAILIYFYAIFNIYAI